MFLRGRGIGASSFTLVSGNAAPTGQLRLLSFRMMFSADQAGGPRSMRSSIEAGSGTPACAPIFSTSTTRSPTTAPRRAAASTLPRKVTRRMFVFLGGELLPALVVAERFFPVEAERVHDGQIVESKQ